MTQKLSSSIGWIFMASLAIFPACDDATGNGGSDTGTDAAGGEGGEGGEGGMGGMGGAGGMIGGECIVDEDCPDTQYCDVPGGALIGACAVGCRADNCGAGQECSTAANPRICTCVTDEGCDGDEICVDGACIGGDICRDDDDCQELTEDGRSQKCDTEPTVPACAPAFVCCGGAELNMCDLTLEGACEGDLIRGVLDCTSDPCAGPACTVDADCPEDRYCGDDGRCLAGCRLDDPNACPEPTEVCDPEKHLCLEIRCDSAADCPDDFFCNGVGVCEEGCDTNDDCDEGEVCLNGDCIISEICESDDECVDGQYCDEVRGFCRDNCEDNAICEGNEFCDVNVNECVIGCRDDVPPFDSVDNALAIELPAEFNADGFKVAVVENRRFCGDMADFFSLDVGQNQRMQMQLSYDPAILENLNLRLLGDEVDGIQEVLGIANPKVIEYPPINENQNATTYFGEVFGDIGLEEGMDYRIRVVVGDASTPCFPDEGEDGAGDDTPATARRQAALLGRYAGNVCAGDEDWFVLPMAALDGINIEASITPESDGLEFLVYSAARLAQPGGLANPVHRSPAVAVDGPNGRTYTLDLQPGAGHFTQDDWYVRVRARDDGNSIYRLKIEKLSGGECGLDGGSEPNDTVMNAVDLNDDQYGVSQGGEVPFDADRQVDLDLEICARDEDVFCFDVEAGDVIEAWTVGAGVAGDFSIQILNNEGGLVGLRGNNNRMGSNSRARWIGAVEGRACVRVDGIEAAQGPYDLFVRRQAGGDMCMNDEDEFGAERNDVAASATPLTEVIAGIRYEYSTGYMCDVNGADEDWYSFPIATPDSALCVMVEGFQNGVADLDMSAFPAAPLGQGCNNDGECQAIAGDRSRCVMSFCAVPCGQARDCAAEEACIAGRCTASPNGYFSRTRFDFEAKSVPRRVLGNRNGPHFVRVDRGAMGNESGYTVSVTVSPETARNACPRDFRERDGANDQQEDATRLGAGQVGFCDAWICEQDEGNLGQGDWYEITVPAGQDRTAIIEFAALPVDGRLYLDYQDPDYVPEDPEDFFGGIRRSYTPVAGFQCINIRGGAAEHDVLLNVSLDAVAVSDNDGRVNYTMRVVPTDLDARPQGECLTYGAPNLGACPADDDLAGDDCWPTAQIQ